MKYLIVGLFALTSISAYAERYFCILAQMDNSVPVSHDRKTADLGLGSMRLNLPNGYSSTIEQIHIPATEHQSASAWLAVSIKNPNDISTDSLYSLDQTHTFLKLSSKDAGVSLQCSKR